MTSVRRKRKQLLFQTAKFFDFFRRNTEAVTFLGNRATLYRYGSEFFGALLEALPQATESICLEFYTIADDDTGRMVADALIAAASRGVRVYVLYDYIGCFDTPAAFFRRLARGGVTCAPFNPPPFRRGIAWFDKRDHRKIVIIDGWRVFTGGMNIADVYSGFGKKKTKWRDVGLRIEGEAGLELLRLFRETWTEEVGVPPVGTDPAPLPELDGDAKVMVVNGGPHQKRSFIRSAFRVAIAGASESVTIASPYFIPGPRVIRSMLRAAGRGVRVRLLLPYKSDVPLVRLVSRTYYGQLLKNGIEIHEMDRAVLHAKVLIIDGDWTMVGSANMDLRSFHRNYELNVVVDSHDFGAQVVDMLETDFAGTRRIVLHEHERRGWPVRLLERLFSPVAWFL
ncbi:phospholipase D-like domain-containing protein [Geomonas paludis]|uniref:Cardiolipin synthase B n=1 Tax=Geomonas paludis TaxID=2740185 RepID=A0A6V8MZL4_9BACT|nr:phospholipase D-like domain-containing protein [Geomonas paludis]UPU34591.1 phospholipase D-like domain-containing protein [Geomonas paludis]GFO64963.1 cardiolipin synthase B [Geomonas paludis]